MFFLDSTSLNNIIIPSSVTSISKYAFEYTGYYNDENNWDNGVLYIGNCLIKANDVYGDYTIKDGTKIIADSAFYYCEGLKMYII